MVNSERWHHAFSLEGETALITGGGTGIGLATSRAFVSAGANVILVGRREEPLRDACTCLGPQANYRIGDITDSGLVAALAAELPGVSILVNNAGHHLKRAALDTTSHEFRTIFETHIMAAFELSRAFAPQMIRRKRGSILLVASMTSLIGMPNVVAYSTAKTACVGLMRSLTADFAPHNIRVNAVAPGWIDTAALRGALDNDPERQRKILDRTPLARFGEPDDIGWAAVYLCSPAARFVTGTLLTVDGGAHMGF